MRIACGHGHEMSAENTYTRPDGRQVCRECIRQYQKTRIAREVQKIVAEAPVQMRRLGEIVTAIDVINHIAADFNLPTSVMMGRSRFRPFVLARRTACYVMHRRGNSLAQIGRRFGIDHKTVRHAVRQFEKSATPEMWAIAERYYAPLGVAA